MKIEKIIVGRVNIPYIEEFPTSFTVYRSVKNVIIEIHTDEGIVGIGEGAPLPGLYGETQDSAVGAIKFLKPELIGLDPFDIVHAHKIMDRMLPIGNFCAKCAIDIALHDIVAKKLNVPLYQILGGKTRDNYSTHIATRPGTGDEMVAEIQQRASEGFRVFKVKLSGNAGEDLELIKYLLDNVSEDLLLNLDVNQGWNVYESVRIVNQIAHYPSYRNNLMIEQPIRSQDLDGLAFITKQSTVPIIADDAVCTKEQALEVVKRQAAHVINVKITKAGGYHPAKQIIGICEAAGMPYIVDEITETRVCGTAVSHLALTVSDLVYGGCTCFKHLQKDTVLSGGLSITDGQVVVEEKPGLGLELNSEIIRFE